MDDCVELPVDFMACQPEETGPEIDVLASRQLGMKTSTEFDERDDMSADTHDSARRPGHTRHELQERRLARAVAADDAETGADGNLERHVAQRPDRRADPSARGSVDFVGLAAQITNRRGDE